MFLANTNLNMWTCQFNMGTDQRWEVEWSKFDDCAFRLHNRDTHMCMDAPGLLVYLSDFNLVLYIRDLHF